MAQNKLSTEASLYLKQHANNPVSWYPWGDEALQKAIVEDKPILVSIGYSSCHWCHVMERESFESDEVASFLNEHFISIKVDREERPDLDHIYMEALQTLSGQGGWPLNMFLTPNQQPFYGGTYFPPRPMYGRPSFLQVLHRINELFTERRTELNQKAEQLSQAIGNDLLEHVISGNAAHLDFQKIIEHFDFAFENDFGGFSTAPKFPQPMIIESLLRIGVQLEDKSALEMALKTLNEMAKGGIHDHVGGGFHRYSTDKEWLVPHFEKMLYDNAQLLHVYALAFRITKNEWFKQVAEGIYACLERDFKNHTGGYGSAWDADSDGEEGMFYCWTQDELKQVLTADELQTISNAGVELPENGNWEGKTILRFIKEVNTDTLGDVSLVLSKLFAVREHRIKPEKDSKVILAWNAMLIQAYFTWYCVQPDIEIKTNAINLVDFFINRKNETGYYERVHGVRAFGDDLGHFGLALLRAFQLTGSDYYLDEAMLIADEIREGFFDAETGAFSLASNTHQLIHTPKELFDNAVPSTQAVCTRFFEELGYLTENQNLAILAEFSLSKMFTLIQKYPSSSSYHLLNGIRSTRGKNECVCLGEESLSWIDVLSDKQFLETYFFTIQSSVDSRFTVLKGKKSLQEKPTLYWCEQFVCQSPVQSKVAFEQMLDL
ncbi:thioredoxin domain-containing protein [bacterium]|nr:MAG: thioredoxin domain-containing protein [bacterium]